MTVFPIWTSTHHSQERTNDSLVTVVCVTVVEVTVLLNHVPLLIDHMTEII